MSDRAMQTFAEKFCQDNRIDPERYEEEILRRALYPRAARFRPLLRLIPGYFAADYNLIQAVGRLTEIRGFDDAEMDYHQHGGNSGFLHRTLGLRLSVRRLKKLVHATLGTGRP